MMVVPAPLPTASKLSSWIIVAGDIHAPFEDKESINILEKRVKDLRPNLLVLDGDILDCQSISRFPRSPGGPDLQAELDVCKGILGRLKKAVGRGRMVVLEGNHESRIRTLLQANPGIYNLRCLTLPSLLGIREEDFLTESEPFRIGNAIAIQHADGCAQNTRMKALARLSRWKSEVVVVGHSHRMSVTYATDRMGTGCSVESGCLCSFEEAQKSYMKSPPVWNHGHIEISIDPNQKTRVVPVFY